jgi:hypothetical protein
MRSLVRGCAFVFAVALFCSSICARPRRPVGVVSEAQGARLDNANAITGADVYDCENLNTDDGGELRLQVRSGQVYLGSGSSAQLEEDSDQVQVFVSRGTVGFAAPAGIPIEITTPAGFLRAANGEDASGEVAIESARAMVITAMRGDLVLDNGGELRTIAQGQSARVTFEGALEPACRVGAGNVHDPIVHHPIVYYLIAPAALTVPSILIVRKEQESDTAPPHRK